MNRTRDYKTRLQVNYTYLVDSLNFDPVADLCFEKQALTFTDMERLRAERSTPDKVKLFVAILKSKSDLKCYEVFLEALENKRVNQPLVKKRLDDTEVTEQREEEFEQLRLLEQIICDCLVVKDKAELPVEDLLKALKFHLHRHHQCLQVSLPETYDLVTKVFSDVSRKRNKRRNVISTALQNCCLKVEASSIAEIADEDVEDFDAASNSVPLETVTPDRVAAVMRVCLEKLKLDVELANRFEEEDIDGEALEELDETLVEKLFPELTMGKRLKLLKARNEGLDELRKTPLRRIVAEKPKPVTKKLESYRAFDSRLRPVDVYEKGHVLPEEQSRPGYPLQPLHKYCLLKKGEDTNTLVQEAVRFASACMNDRVNGTIHFGVAGKYDGAESTTKQHAYAAGEIVGLRVDKQNTEFAITEEIYRAFFPDQREVAIKCIRDPVFVPVVGKDVSDRGLYVVEVDIVPQSCLVGNEAFFLSPVTGKHSLLYRYKNGSTVAVEGQDLHEFMGFRKQLTAQRKDSERAARPQSMRGETPTLNRKLHTLLTGEHEFEVTDIYPLLFAGPISGDMTNDFLVGISLALKAWSHWPSSTSIQRFKTAAVSPEVSTLSWNLTWDKCTKL